ncbi:MAG: hypothetical protein M0Z65_12945 [Firmicutes bacterium]|uniref:Uncharacterized protein n=1 Tax=Melghirimyces thermohalophilus TaxID=1236220 RepID=A0A1G6RBZ5_9BACL|nr:hypothetical protein [Melghirimyces thermohalophilus]MDA8354053.1 hypothetical protein [Bacillota bacterium]SDD02150.1 hypothetical protein SAMN04488112_12734 [Melghirimyces thermohalophilus]
MSRKQSKREPKTHSQGPAQYRKNRVDKLVRNKSVTKNVAITGNTNGMINIIVQVPIQIIADSNSTVDSEDSNNS